MEHDTVITSQEVKQWCRIDNDAYDTAIDLLILTAQEHAAAYTGRILEPYTCPSGIKQVIAVFVADLYANREGQTVGDRTFNRLLNPFVLSSL